MYDYSARCHVCGAPLDASALYCSSCGTPRAEPPPVTGQPESAAAQPARLLADESPDYSQLGSAASGAPGGYAPPPPQGAAPPIYPGMVQAAQVTRTPSSSPVVFEVLLGLFGIYGVGWLMAGKTTTGVILLALSAVWWLVTGVSAAHTAFITCCGSVPLNVIFAVISAVLLRNAMRRG